MIPTVLAVLHLIFFLIAGFEILMSGKPLIEKVLWLLLIFFAPLVGLIIYFLLGRGK